MTRDDLLAASRGGMLFSTPMVRALLADQKTRTMRVVKPKLLHWGECNTCNESELIRFLVEHARYKPGDIIYVRETWQDYPPTPPSPKTFYFYKADDEYPNAADKWRPSLFMPKAAARIFVRFTAITAQRPQALTGDEILAEGVPCPAGREQGLCVSACSDCWVLRHRWETLWDSLRSKKDMPVYGYAADPLCFVYGLERMVPDAE